MSELSIIGHEKEIENIKRTIEMKKMSHAHIIGGEDGIGKSLIAEYMAHKILGVPQNRECVDIIKWRIKKDKQSIGVDEIRVIIEEANKKPYEGDKKVIIIYDGHKMTPQAQNALLKTIEEPPIGVFVIMLCESLDIILDTIKSRCQIYKLKRLNKEEMDLFIKREYPNLKKEELKPLKAFAEGIPGRCKTFLEDKAYKIIREYILEILLTIRGKGEVETVQYEKFISSYKKQVEEVLNSFLSYLRDAIIYKDTRNKELIINADYIDKIKDIAEIYSFNQLDKMVEIINITRIDINTNVNLELAFSVMLLKIQEV